MWKSTNSNPNPISFVTTERDKEKMKQKALKGLLTLEFLVNSVRLLTVACARTEGFSLDGQELADENRFQTSLTVL